MVEVSELMVLGRPRLGLISVMKMTLGSRGITVQAAQQCVKDRKEWSTLVHMEMLHIKNGTQPFVFDSCVLSDRPPALWLLLTRRVVDAVT